MRMGSSRGRGVLTGQVNARHLHTSSHIHGTVDTGLDVVQWAGDSEEFTLVGRRGQHDRTTSVGKELVQGIFPIAKDELMLATVDCQLTKGQPALQLTGEPLNLSTGLLRRGALPRHVDALIGNRHELNLTGKRLLGRWLGLPCVITRNMDLRHGALFNFSQIGIVGTRDEREELGRDRLESEAHVRGTLLYNCFDFPTGHLCSNRITLNKHINGVTIVDITRSRIIDTGHLHAGTGTLLDVLDNGTLPSDDVRTS